MKAKTDFGYFGSCQESRRIKYMAIITKLAGIESSERHEHGNSPGDNVNRKFHSPNNYITCPSTSHSRLKTRTLSTENQEARASCARKE